MRALLASFFVSSAVLVLLWFRIPLRTLGTQGTALSSKGILDLRLQKFDASTHVVRFRDCELDPLLPPSSLFSPPSLSFFSSAEIDLNSFVFCKKGFDPEAGEIHVEVYENGAESDDWMYSSEKEMDEVMKV